MSMSESETIQLTTSTLSLSWECKRKDEEAFCERKGDDAFRESVKSLIEAYNKVIDANERIDREIDELGRGIDKLKAQIKERKEREKEIEKYAIVGQIYYTFQECVISKVFDGRPVPVYTLEEMEEDFQDDYFGHDDSRGIFQNVEERDAAVKKWESLKEKIDWNEDDMDTLEYIERYEYGFVERRRTAKELRDALEMAKDHQWFGESVVSAFDRFVSMYEKLV